MNRQTKRMLQRQGQLNPDGTPATSRPTQPRPSAAGAGSAGGRRKGPFQFIGDVRSELRKVAWPTRREVANYSVVVFITLVILVSLIFVLDFAFAKSILFLFDA